MLTSNLNRIAVGILSILCLLLLHRNRKLTAALVNAVHDIAELLHDHALE